jgi:hypothetical protein
VAPCSLSKPAGCGQLLYCRFPDQTHCGHITREKPWKRPDELSQLALLRSFAPMSRAKILSNTLSLERLVGLGATASMKTLATAIGTTLTGIGTRLTGAI